MILRPRIGWGGAAVAFSSGLFAAFPDLQTPLLVETAHAQIAAANADPRRSPNADVGVRSPDLDQVPSLIVRRTNELREAHGSPSTVVNAQLSRAAQYFADFMARTDQHGHNADGSTPSARAKQYGYNFCMVSENIAFQFHSAGFATDELARRFVEGWEKSPGHRKNMLDPDAMETGTAVARSPRTGRFYAVQMFGRPQSATYTFQIANRLSNVVHYQLDGQEFDLPVRSIRTHEQCRPVQIIVQGVGEPGKSNLQTANGDRFAIVRDRQGLRLVKE